MPITVVTGSASGIGAAVVKSFQAAGHWVIGVDRQQADVVADLSSAEGRSTAVEQIRALAGESIDGLVCCAGLGVTAPSCGLIISVNYFGMVDLVEGVADLLGKGNKPAVLLVGSVASVQPNVDQAPMVPSMLAGDEERSVEQANQLGNPAAAYAASKYAVTAWARAKAVEWGNKGIRLNVVAPGAVETPLHRQSLDDPRFGQAVRNFVAPLGRAGQPEEIATLISFLQSEQAAFVHGTVVFIDGGMDAMIRKGRF